MNEIRLSTVLSALADPGRIAIVRVLNELGETSCSGALWATDLGIGRSTFSHHQKVLREAGILRVRIKGAQRLVSLRVDELHDRFPGLLDAILEAPADRV